MRIAKSLFFAIVMLLNLQARAQAPSCQSIFTETVDNSNLIRLFRESAEVEVLRQMPGKTMRDLAIKPGTSYTALIYKEKLFLGDNIIGMFDSRYGGRGSHLTLRSILKASDFIGGAVRVNLDGSIDISGYHGQKSDPDAEFAIRRIIERVAPMASIRSTPDRLSTLP